MGHGIDVSWVDRPDIKARYGPAFASSVEGFEVHISYDALQQNAYQQFRRANRYFILDESEFPMQVPFQFTGLIMDNRGNLRAVNNSIGFDVWLPERP